MELRQWQKDHLEILKDITHSVAVAPPGSGKSLLAAKLADDWFEKGFVDHVIYFAPQRQVQRTIQREWTHQLGLRTYVKLKSAHPGRLSYDVTALCYQVLSDRTVDHLIFWARACKLGLVCDEFHHLKDEQAWGRRFGDIRALCTRSLMMSGTAFRADGAPISGVKYDADGRVQPNTHLLLVDAVKHRYVRRIVGQHIDVDSSGIEFVYNGTLTRFGSFRDVPNDLVSAAGKSALESETFLYSFVRQVVNHTRNLRRTKGYEDSGALWVCPPRERGGERFLNRIRDIVAEVSGEDVSAVSSEDETSQGKIDRFREDSSQSHLCAIRMISEGVDIKRLRVLALLTWPESELLLRQLAGRVARVQQTDLDSPNPMPAVIFHLPFPYLSDRVRDLTDETNLPTADLDPPVTRCFPPGPEREPATIVPIHVGEAVLSSAVVNETDVEESYVGRATRIKTANPLGTQFWDARDIAFVLKQDTQWGGGEETVEVAPAQECENLGREINRLVTRLGRIRAINGGQGKPLGEAIALVWSIEVHRRFNVASADEMQKLFTKNQLEQVASHLRNLVREEAVR